MEEGESMDKSKTKDITLRILSVLMAIILWTYVIGIDNPTTKSEITVPVKLVNTDSLAQAGFILVGYQDTVKVSIEGRKKDIQAVKAEGFTAEANLGAAYRVKGHNLVPVEIKNKPANIDVENRAYYIDVELDEMVERSFPVQVVIEKDKFPKDGYSYLAPSVKPTEVLLKGASRNIGSINSVVVKPDISNAVSDVAVSLPVQVLDKNGKSIYDVVDVTPKMVDVTIPIQRAKEVGINVVTTGKFPAGVFEREISSSPRTVTITGSEDAVNGINAIDTQPIPLDGITSNTVRQAKLNIPEGVTVSGNIQTVNVNISVETTISRTFSVLVSQINLPEGLKAELLTNTIFVTLSGQESTLNSVTASDISAVVDLSSAQAEDGEYEFDVNVSIPENPGLNLREYSPQKIKVKITKKQG